jgi:hypothetical protein
MPRSQGKKFSIVALHNTLDATLDRLNKQTKTKKRDELIDLVKGLRADTKCPQIMVIDLGTS